MVLADPQLGMMAHFTGQTAEEAAATRARGWPVEAAPKSDSWETEEKLFAAAIAEADRIRPDFVVVCGDMVMRWDNAAQIETVRRVAAGLDKSVPIYWVPGNHDVGVDSLTPSLESLAAYRNVYGPDYFAFHHGNNAFVVINSPLIDRPAEAQAEFEAQMTWLRRTLYSMQFRNADRIIAFAHHPPFLRHPDEEDEVFNLRSQHRQMLLDLLMLNGVRYIFTGHTHQNVSGRYAGLEVVATAAVGMNRIGEQSGYRLVRVTTEGVSHSYHAITA